MAYTTNDFIRAAKAMKIEDKGLNNQYRYGEIQEVGDLKTEQKYTRHKEICDNLNELYITKNKEYGDSFGKAYKRLGLVSCISDIFHKMERLLGIYDKDDVSYESMEDTLIDMANYCIMTLVEMEDDR